MKKKIDIDKLGKLPPMSIKEEEAVLGAIILEGEKAYSSVAPIFEGDNIFYKETNAIIWESIVNLVDTKQVIDTITLNNDLNKKGKLDDIGGPLYLINLTKNIGSSAHIKDHARIARQTWVSREIIRIIDKAHDKVFENKDDIFNIYKELDYNLSNLFSSNTGASININDAVNNALFDIKGRKEGTIRSGIKTNSDFDDIFDFSPNELIWLGGLPKSGKTKTIIKILSLLLKNNEDIAINWFSMEDDQTKLLANIGSLETGIRTKAILNKDGEKINDEEYKQISESLNTYRNYDSQIAYGSHTVDKLCLQSKNFVRKRPNKLNIIVADNFNVLVEVAPGLNDNAKENYVAGKLRQLKLDTNEGKLNTIIIVLDHLNKKAIRDVVKMAGRPELKTLKGTGKKSEILTQLISINKPSEHKEFLSEEVLRKDIVIKETLFKRADIIKNMVIYETLLAREDESFNKILRMQADYNTMQFQSFDDYIDDKIKEEGVLFKEVTTEKVISEDNLNVNEIEIDDSFLNNNHSDKPEDVPF